MAGPGDLMTLEDRYLEALNAARFLTIMENRVRIGNTDRSSALELEPVLAESIKTVLMGKKLLLARMIAEGNKSGYPASHCLRRTMTPTET